MPYRPFIKVVLRLLWEVDLCVCTQWQINLTGSFSWRHGSAKPPGAPFCIPQLQSPTVHYTGHCLIYTNQPASSWWLQMSWCQAPGHQQPPRWFDCDSCRVYGKLHNINIVTSLNKLNSRMSIPRWFICYGRPISRDFHSKDDSPMHEFPLKNKTIDRPSTQVQWYIFQYEDVLPV